MRKPAFKKMKKKYLKIDYMVKWKYYPPKELCLYS